MPLPQLDRIASRRRFLQFLAASPLLADVNAPAFAQSMMPSRLPDPMAWAPRDLDNLISDPQEALDVFDFEPVAKKNLPPAHFGYMVTGIDDEVTLRANREGFHKFQLRPLRLLFVFTIAATTEILGATYDSPIVIAPTGSNRAFHTPRISRWIRLGCGCPAPIWISRRRGSNSSWKARPKIEAMWSEGWRRFLPCNRRMKPSASAS